MKVNKPQGKRGKHNNMPNEYVISGDGGENLDGKSGCLFSMATPNPNCRAIH